MEDISHCKIISATFDLYWQKIISQEMAIPYIRIPYVATMICEPLIGDSIVCYRVAEAKQYSSDNVQVVLVGNKCDCEERRVVTYEQGQELADQLECPFFEASAKDNVNVDDAFEKLIDMICDNIRASGESETTNTGDDNTKIVALIAVSQTQVDLHLCQRC